MNRFEKGLDIRRKVLGADYVDKALQDAEGGMFQPFQELLTEFAWGQIWTRPGLDLKTRSLLTLAFCIALNRPHEIKLHLRGAIRNGCTEEQIQELVLHAFIYCGGPACVDAMNVIRATLPSIPERIPSGIKRPTKKSTNSSAARSIARKVAPDRPVSPKRQGI